MYKTIDKMIDKTTDKATDKTTETFTCVNKCCTLYMQSYKKNKFYSHHSNAKKAGVFIIDPVSGKVLLVQSRGMLWGLPKGSIKHGETERDCAIRETLEETGLEVSEQDFVREFHIQKATYFYIERTECDVCVQTHIEDNDANALGWIKPECLEKMITSGVIIINKQCRIAFKKFINRLFPESAVILAK